MDWAVRFSRMLLKSSGFSFTRLRPRLSRSSSAPRSSAESTAGAVVAVGPSDATAVVSDDPPSPVCTATSAVKLRTRTMAKLAKM
jgi:hypothetical protein